MTPAHRRGPGLHISGPNGRMSFSRDEPYGWLPYVEHVLVTAGTGCPPRDWSWF